MVKKGKVEILIDIGQIGASYIHGHAHADTSILNIFMNRSLLLLIQVFLHMRIII